MYDVIIIGAGPAGISASLYAKRSNLNVLVLYNGESNLNEAKKIENYYGFTNGIDGEKLYEDGIKQAKNIGVEIEKQEVVRVESYGEIFNVKTVNEEFETKSIIISTGNKKKKPNIKGIGEFTGKGISYCAICDGFFYRNKNVAVIGNGNFALNEAEELSHIAKSVIILTDGLERPKCQFEINTKKIKEIYGKEKVSGIEFEDGNKIDIDGIFIALGEAGASDFAKTLGILQNGENIIVNDKMETNIKGIYACGNITGGLQQICKAVYEGAKAGISVASYIRNN